MKTALVTIACGALHEEMGRITHPTFQAYATRIGADFLVWNDFHGHQMPHYKKTELGQLLDRYQRVLYLDTDILVRDDTPNLFELVPEDRLGALEEGQYADHVMTAARYMFAVGYNAIEWDRKYYNTGVLVVSQAHRAVFTPPDVEVDCDKEQTYLNLMIAYHKTPMFELPYRFNRTFLMDWVYGEERLDSYILHYAGAWAVASPEQQLETIRSDWRAWQQARPAYHFPRHFVFALDGSVSDQVAAEPSVRYAKEVLYPGDEIVVECEFPELLTHLNLPVFRKVEEVPGAGKWGKYRICHTRHDPAHVFVERLFPERVHRVNECSLRALGVELPVVHRTPRVTVHEEARAALAAKTGGSDLARLVVLDTRLDASLLELPYDIWESYVAALSTAGIAVALIGEGDADATRPASGCLDLRGRLSVAELLALLSQARALITADAGSVTLAGAFENWIGFIATSAHPEYVLPWRKGSQSYRADSLERARLYELEGRQPSAIEPVARRWSAAQLRASLPEPSSIVEFVRAASDT